jgi:hypothetical protein
MRRLLACALVVSFAGSVFAQPGGYPQPQPQPAPSPYPAPYPQPYPQPQPQPQPQPYPQPAPYYGVPAPYQYQPAVQLTAEEHELLMKGEISEGEHFGGGLAALFLGFGIGQGIQGRWSDNGWLFTLGEIGAIGLIIYGATRTFDCNDGIDHTGRSCRSDAGTGTLIVGALGFTGLRIWETIDAFSAPSEYNRRVRMVRMKAGYHPMGVYGLYVSPPKHGEGGVAGVSLRF